VFLLRAKIILTQCHAGTAPANKDQSLRLNFTKGKRERLQVFCREGAFITSAEYQQRFSSVVTHTNGERGP
jgi:hypothetical protein